MSTLHQRRTMLSLYRRSGSQLPPDVANGRCQRGAQGYRDLNPGEWAEAPAGIVQALMLALGTWAVLAVAVFVAVWVLG